MAAPSSRFPTKPSARNSTKSLVHQVVTAYRNGGRAGTKAQLTKAEVRGGGRKPRPQKGGGTVARRLDPLAHLGRRWSRVRREAA